MGVVEPEIMESCTKEERELLDKLRDAAVVSPSPYDSNKGELTVFRFRLFTEAQRALIRKALTTGEGADFLGMPGSAGMMDELEMVRFECHGKKVSDIERTI